MAHCPNNHWVTLKERPSSNDIKLFDSVLDSPQTAVYTVASNLYNVQEIIVMVPMQNRQPVWSFSIAVATALAFERDPYKLEFIETEMRNHLKTCFEAGATSMYPVKYS